jgi:YfiH family protein
MTPTTTWTCPPSSADVTGEQRVLNVEFTPHVEGWFTGAHLDGLDDANLAHHVPHTPDRLAAARERVAVLTDTDAAEWNLMRQVHGAQVGIVDATVAPGVEVRGVDVLVTTLLHRPLVVLSADCIPILAAGRRAIGVAHAGWRGVVAGVPAALVGAMEELGERAEDISVVLGPAIGPCCYGVGQEVVAAISDITTEAIGRTRSGRDSVDLRSAARNQLAALGVGRISDAGGSGADDDLPGGAAACTSCDPAWFSHRRDPHVGRQAGIIVRRGASTAKDPS